LDKLAKEMRGEEAAQQVIDQTTLKGRTFEEEVLERARDWAKVAGAEVEHVGGDNQPGDVLLVIKTDSLSSVVLRIAVEAKDRAQPLGRKALTQEISAMLNSRSANYGIWVSKTAAGYAKEIGEWAEGEADGRPWLACTFDLLPVALRFAVVQQRLTALRQEQPEVNAGSIVAQVQRIRTAVARVGTITRKVTEVRTSAQGIQDEGEALRDEIKAALGEIEDALRTKPIGVQVAA
jgi:hypothetical protein